MSIAFPVVVLQMAYAAAAISRATILVPSGDQARLETGIPGFFREACSIWSIWPVEGSQRCSPPAESPTARRVPSGDQVTIMGQKEGIGNTFLFGFPLLTLPLLRGLSLPIIIAATIN